MRNDIAETVPAELDLARFLPYRLSVLTNRISGAIARIYSGRFDPSIPEWRTMAVLGSTTGLSAGEVAQRTAMDKVQVSRAVARLVACGRVARIADTADARIVRLSLTRAGRSIHDEIAPLALALEAVLLGALTQAERESLDAILTKLSRQANRLGSFDGSATRSCD
jgi:DNA-binding MarR family transcriptional regulator